MNTKEKVVLGFLIVGIIVWGQIMNKQAQKRIADKQRTAQNQGSGKNGEPGKPTAPKVKPNPGEPNKGDDKKPVAPPPEPVKVSNKAEILPEFAELKPAKKITLRVKTLDDAESPLVDYIVDPQKGGIVSAILHKYKKRRESDERMTIGNEKFPILSFDGEKPLKFTNAKIIEKTDVSVSIARQIVGTTIVVKQTWIVTPGQYRFRYKLSLENRGQERALLPKPRLLTGVMSQEAPPKGMFGASGMDQVARFYPTNDNESDYEMIAKIAKFGDKKKTRYLDLSYHWVSVQNKFFVISCRGISPDAKTGEESAKTVGVPMRGATFLAPIIKTDKPQKRPARELVAYVNLPDMAHVNGTGGVVTKEYEVYLGPKIYSKLKELGAQQEEIMGFGRLIYPTFSFMRWIALGIYKLVVWLGGAVHNFGIAIILATILIRFILMPITYRSSVWSQRMKEVQPKMKEIKEKYGHDQQKVGQMTMALYREHKINPLGGCLPIFVQLPVFFALFNVLRSAIELRHAGFIWWIQDLSQPDALCLLPEGLPLIGGMPLNILPFLMAGGTYLQQKTMPTSADPMQQKMMAFMTIFILFVCYTMPSGLTLYWTVGTVCSIAQFKITQKLLAKQGNAITKEKGKDKKKKK